MRIAIVASPALPIPPAKYGGTERVIEFLVKGLLELGQEVVLLASGDSQVDCELIPICDTHIPFELSKEKEEEAKKLRIEAEKKAIQILKDIRGRIDIIHSHGIDLTELKDFPNLTTLHGPIDFTNMDYFESRKDLYYISISQNQQNPMPDLNYVGTVYNGLDPEPFKFVAEPEDYLCFLGRFARMKQPHVAIQLALKLGMKLKLAGKIDFDGSDYFETEVKPYLNHPLIEYLGELGMEDKINLLSKAKCNLHPIAWREPFGLSIIESAYCGTPTLAINLGSMKELIEEGRTGVLVEDFTEGVQKIEKCFECNREYVSQRARLLFNYKVMAKQYVLAYEKVIEIFNQKMFEDKQAKGKFLEGSKSGLRALWESLIRP
jgi:glycosyltransferase involved in cell wall biosynthesis